MGKKKERNKGLDSVNKPTHPEALRACKIIATHDAVVTHEPVLENTKEGGFVIKFEMDVALPSRARPNGLTETGVKSKEPITFVFPPEYPFRAPFIILRSDFNKSLPHINPYPKVVNPCVYEGSLDELLHQEGDGLSRILNQLSEWLRRAASNQLIDPDQGWEPIRRDHILGWMIFDLKGLRQVVSENKGFAIFKCRFPKNLSEKKEYIVSGIDPAKPARLTPAFVDEMYRLENTYFGLVRTSFAILAWPDEYDGDTAKTVDRYLPETVTNLGELYERAEIYGCAGPLKSALKDFIWAWQNSGKKDFDVAIVFIILVARRPLPLIGDDSTLEMMPYLLLCQMEPAGLPLNSSSIKISEGSGVISLGHRHSTSADLLRKMSGGKRIMTTGPIIMIGCGSVGSKVAMHLARAGHGPFSLIDKGVFSPHNAARHALTCPTETASWPKAQLLAQEIRLLSQRADPFVTDVRELFRKRSEESNPLPQDASITIDSSGSVLIREFLASLPQEQLPGRLFHTGLYANGKIGFIAIEGKDRNPNISDLVARLWQERIADSNLAAEFSDPEDEIGRHDIGQGCGSFTMIMPDTRVSLFAAGMAEMARQILESNAPEFGKLSIGLLTNDEMGISWQHYMSKPTTILKTKSMNQWEIRILTDVVEEIEAEAKAWGMTETGGVLIGKVSLVRRCFTITGLIEAPPDSIRTETVFILGVQGLKDKVEQTRKASGETLTYIGTWHSHPRGGRASSVDEKSLSRIKKLRFGAPSLGLIWTPYGFHALVNEGKLE